MSWARIKPAKLERFFTGLSAARVESVVRYFHLRHSPRKIREINDLSEFSAFPWMGLKRGGTIDHLIYQRAADLVPGGLLAISSSHYRWIRLVFYKLYR
jgi:hypothetical protein